MKKTFFYRYNQNAMVLIVTLWVLALLSIFAVVLGSRAALQISVARRMNMRLDTFYLAEAGLNAAIDILNNDQDLEVDYLSEGWAEEIAQELEKGSFLVTIQDESRKINVNKVASLKKLGDFGSTDLASEILNNIDGFDDDLSVALLDWIDADDITRGSAGSEDETLYFTRQIKNADLEFIEEGLFLREMNEEALKNASEFLSCYASAINVNTVDFDDSGNCRVLSILGVSDDLISDIWDWRISPEGYIKNLNDLPSFVEDLDLKDFLDVKSRFFNIVARGQLKAKADYYEVKALYDRQEKKIISRENSFVSVKEEQEEI